MMPQTDGKTCMGQGKKRKTLADIDEGVHRRKEKWIEAWLDCERQNDDIELCADDDLPHEELCADDIYHQMYEEEALPPAEDDDPWLSEDLDEDSQEFERLHETTSQDEIDCEAEWETQFCGPQ